MWTCTPSEKKGVIKIQVHIMNRDLLPYSTDMVFGTKGFDLTFTLEPTDFEPVAPSPYNLFAPEDDKGPNGGVDKQDETNQKAKKSKSSKLAPQS